MTHYYITSKLNTRKDIAQYNREISQISGRFCKVYKDSEKTVVGAVGSMSMRKLTEAQYRHVVSFYQGNPDTAKTEYVTSFPVSVNQAMYNDFLIIKKEATQ